MSLPPANAFSRLMMKKRPAEAQPVPSNSKATKATDSKAKKTNAAGGEFGSHSPAPPTAVAVTPMTESTCCTPAAAATTPTAPDAVITEAMLAEVAAKANAKREVAEAKLAAAAAAKEHAAAIRAAAAEKAAAKAAKRAASEGASSAMAADCSTAVVPQQQQTAVNSRAFLAPGAVPVFETSGAKEADAVVLPMELELELAAPSAAAAAGSGQADCGSSALTPSSATASSAAAADAIDTVNDVDPLRTKEDGKKEEETSAAEPAQRPRRQETSKMGGSSSVASGKSPAGKPSNDEGAVTGAKELERFKGVLRLLLKHKEADPFLEPVDWQGLGLDDYPEVVAHPMDLNAVQARLERGEYAEVLEAAADVELIWSNSMLYNPAENWVYQAAVEMKAFADLKLAPLVASATARLKGAAEGRAVRKDATAPDAGAGGKVAAQAEGSKARHAAKSAKPSGGGGATSTSADARASCTGGRRAAPTDFFLTPAQKEEKKAKAEAEAAAKKAEEAAAREAARAQKAAEEESRRAAEAEAARLAALQRQQEAKDRWAADQARLKADLAAVNAGRSVASIFSKPTAAFADAVRMAAAAEANRAPLREHTFDVDDVEALADDVAAPVEDLADEALAAATAAGVSAWYEAWPWDAAFVAQHFGAAAAPPGIGAPEAAAADFVHFVRGLARLPTRASSDAIGNALAGVDASSSLLEADEPIAPAPSGAWPRGTAASVADSIPVDATRAAAKAAAAKARWLQLFRRDEGSGGTVPCGTMPFGGGLWVDGLRPRCSDEVCGNRQVTAALQRWLSQWGDAAAAKARALERRVGPCRGAGKRRRKRAADSDDDFVIGSDEDDGPTGHEDGGCGGEAWQVAIVHGPCGVGKSAAVYACAAELRYKVIEVNASQIRSGKALLTNFAEATQSHELSKWSAVGGVAAALVGGASVSATGAATDADEPLKPRASKLAPTKAPPLHGSKASAAAALFGRALPKQPNPSAPATAPTPAPAPAPAPPETKPAVAAAFEAVAGGGSGVERSLILVEEVDITFEDDVGFYAALIKLVATTKCPIVLTCNELPGELLELDAPQFAFVRPPPSEVLPLVAAACEAAGLNVREEALLELVEHLGGDLRRLLHTLQCWAATTTGTPPTTGLPPTTGTPATSDAGPAPPMSLERCIGLGNLCGTASIGRVLLQRSAHVPVPACALACRGRSELECTLHATPLLDHPLRLLDVMADGALLGAATYEQTLDGQCGLAPPAVGATVADEATDEAVALGDGPSPTRLGRRISRGAKRGGAAESDADAAAGLNADIDVAAAARRGSGRLSLGRKRVVRDDEEVGGAEAAETAPEVAPVEANMEPADAERPDSAEADIAATSQPIESEPAEGEVAMADGVEATAVAAKPGVLDVAALAAASAARLAAKEVALEVAADEQARCMEVDGEAAAAPPLAPDHAPVFVPPPNAWAFSEPLLSNGASVPSTEPAQATEALSVTSTLAADDVPSMQATLDAVAALYDGLAAAETQCTPPATPLGPHGTFVPWDTLPPGAAEVRASAACMLQVLSLRAAFGRLPAAIGAGSATLRLPNRSLLLLPSEAAQAATLTAEAFAALAPLMGRCSSLLHACGSGPAAARAAHLEGVGALRRIVRLEALRKASNKARRFQHALGRFGLGEAELAQLRPLY